MVSLLLPDQIAVIGLLIFAGLSILAYFRKRIFHNDEESSESIKVQLACLLAASFGLLLVRREFAHLWGDIQSSYTAAYSYLALANIAAVSLFIIFLRNQKLPRNVGHITISRFPRQNGKYYNTNTHGGRESRKRTVAKIEEDGLIQQAMKILEA